MSEPWTELLTRANRASRRVFGDRCLRGIDADDAAQRWVVRQWKSGKPDLGYAYREARLHAVGLAKRGRERSPYAEHWLAERLPDDPEARTPEDTVGLAEAVRALPMRERTVVVEWMASGCSQRAAAKALHMDPATYMRRWHEALAMLRIILEGDTDAR